VDAVYITVADKDEPSADMKRLALDYGAELSYFPWVGDFSAARNFNMSQCKESWYTWLDADDEVKGMDKAREAVSKLPASIDYVLCPYEYSYFPSGEVDTVHPRERFFRMGCGFQWKGKLHETCITPDKRDGARLDCTVWMHRTTHERSLESSKRNIVIIEQEIKEQSDTGKLDPRTIFNLGMAYASVANLSNTEEDWHKAIKAFHEYLKVGGYDKHAYMAWKFIGEAFMHVNRNDLALDAFFECLKIDPAVRDAKSLLGSAYLSMNDDQRAEPWFHCALLSGNENEYATDKGVSFVTPLIGLAEINGRRGRLNDAEQFLKMAKKHVGSNPAIDGMLGEIKGIKRAKEDAEMMVTKMKKLPVAKQEEAYEAIPTHMKSHPTISSWRRTQSWKKATSGKEVTIFCGHSWEPWTPDTAKTGIGGSEEAVIELAKRMKNLGWDVTVYGRHDPEAKEYDGVWYRPYWTWMPHEPTDVFIGWRDSRVFDVEINAKVKYLWLHDAYQDKDITETRRAKIDRIMVLSDYHRSLLPSVKDEVIFKTSNGITPAHFDSTGIKRNPHDAIYCSAPDRGLEVLLKMWPEIRNQVPDARLFVAYGWNTFEAAHRTNPLMMRWMESMKEQLRQPGIVELGRIGHLELAKKMMECGVWTYPTMFNEVNCITARKVQAAGCIPVHTGMYAIGEPELCKYGYNLQQNDICHDASQQADFITTTVNSMNTTDFPRDEMSEYAKAQFSWDKTASQWNEEISSMLASKN
jgi:glycosyltransferase involved in cell wall biosynthesis